MIQLLKNISPFNNREHMPKALFVIKKILAFWLCFISGLFTAELIIIIMHFPFGKNMLVGNVFDTQIITVITYYGYILVLASALLYWKLIEKKPLSQMGVSKHIITYPLGTLAGVLLLAVPVVSIILAGGMSCNGIFENINIWVIILLAGGFVIQGAAEEFLCRGIVLHTLREKTSTWVAITVSTALFIIPHLPSLLESEISYCAVGIANLVIVSVILSLLTIRFKSIWAACGLHSAWNAVLYCILGLDLSGNNEAVSAVFDMQSLGNSILNGGDYGIEASILTTAVLAIAAVVLLILNKRTESTLAHSTD